MSTAVQSVSRRELLALVDKQRVKVRNFIDWAEHREANGRSMYLTNRLDICDAREAAAWFPEAWWGVVVFTCFGSLESTRAVRDILARPVEPKAAKKLLDSVHFTRPKVGHHRIQQGLTGAHKALIAACEQYKLLYKVLHTPGTFDDRYQHLRDVDLDRWGRTTYFDLLLRTGALGIGGHHYEPHIAYLANSTGPKKGFLAVWGKDVTTETAPLCEGILQAWYRHWTQVVERVGAHWPGKPYAPGDLENALCIYQELADHSCSSKKRVRHC